LDTHINGREIRSLEPDNHFNNAFIDFYNKTLTRDHLECNYKEILNQSRLLSELKKKADEK
jgi:hypothetical protein